MMIIDKILDWARGRGYTAVYGSAGQVNEMLTDVDFAASHDSTTVIMHLVTDSATVDGKDTAVVAVYFASLCDLDFDGEQLLLEQERLKNIGKDLLNDIRTGNEMTYSDPRWQYGYDDYAENVCWVCLRVTLTASAADCVPLVIPEPPAPAKDYMYFEAAEANSTVSMMSTLATAPNLEYSTDGETWQEWQHTTAEGTHTFDTLTLTAVGDRVYLRGDNPDGLFDTENMLFSNISMTGQIKAGGSVTSIIDGDGVSLTEIPAGGFGPLFAGSTDSEPNTCLITAPSFGNVTTIGKYGCYFMFQNCTNLTSGPDMRLITTIKAGGCIGMLGGCSSLHTVSDMESLTSVEIGSCQNMFVLDTSLSSAAGMPALETIGYEAFNGMYGGCTFNMSDDGTTLNFDFPTPPITTTGDDPQTYATAYDIANWMGNTNGF